MTTAKLLSIGFLLALAGCESKPAAKNEALAFFQAKNYAYVTRVSAIPTAALNRIAEEEGDTLRICDVESGLPIDLSDSPLNEKGCRSKLNFALVGDSGCVLSYLNGGWGVHQVVCYLTYKGSPHYEKYYVNSGEANSVEQLSRFLEVIPRIPRSLQQPKLTEEYSWPLTPPPPWPKKLPKAERP